MAEITKGELIQELVETSGIQSSAQVPRELANSFISSIESNPHIVRPCSILKAYTNAASSQATIWTTPSDKDFYLVGLTLSCSYDSSSDNTQTSVFSTIGGAVTRIAYIMKQTLTAQDQTITLNFEHPLKIDRGVIIYVKNEYTVGAGQKACVLWGYEQ